MQGEGGKFVDSINCSLRTKESLPYWGRGHGAAVTEEVLPQYVFAARQRKNETLYRTSPAPYGGTLPKGEGLRLRRESLICFWLHS